MSMQNSTLAYAPASAELTLPLSLLIKLPISDDMMTIALMTVGASLVITVNAAIRSAAWATIPNMRCAKLGRSDCSVVPDLKRNRQATAHTTPSAIAK